MDLKERIFAGKGERKADSVFVNCKLINVNTHEILDHDIAVKNGYIVGIGDVTQLKGEDTSIIDLEGRHVCPGLLDGHVHFESSMVTLGQFARYALLHGTTGVVIDPHEVANVLGRRGVELVLEEAASLPFNVFVAISSCVPATAFETSGASILPEDIEALIDNENVVALAEVMDYPGVLAGDEGKLSMIRTALEDRLVVDGHCPAMQGPDLWGYMCAGISSDHESIEYEEALEKLRLGMKLMIREGSAARALDRFLPRLIEDRINLQNVFFVTDDKHPADLLEGYMDNIVRRSIAMGLSPLDAISMCTLHTARHFHLDHLVGSLSIGRKADMLVLDDLETFKIHSIYASGVPARSFTPIFEYPEDVFNTIRFKELAAVDICMTASPCSEHTVNVIKVSPDQLLTGMEHVRLISDDRGVLQADPAEDILNIAVVERHGKNGNIGKGFICGLGLKGGAMGQSVGHDSHNVIVSGTNHNDMAICANTIRDMNGGICLVRDGKVLEKLPLPFAGLVSTDSVENVKDQLDRMHRCVKDMGCTLPAPFITHSFVALPVIPSARMTDRGLFDVDRFCPIDTIVD